MSFTLLSSPLQGFTDFRFRNAFNEYFGGIDTFYSPYIRLNGKMKIKGSYEPWNSIVKMSQATIIKKMEAILNKYVVENNEVQEKLDEKREYIK